MRRLRAALCKVFGHLPPVPETGYVRNRKALAAKCPRCEAVLNVRLLTRAEGRRIMFGRSK